MHTIQIGPHTGDDPFVEFFSSKHEEIKKCLIVEALSSSLDICKNTYEKRFTKDKLNKISFINKAIVEDPTVDFIDFFCPKGEHENDGQIKYTAFSSTCKNHLISHGVKDIEKKEVPAITLSKLFKEQGFKKVDRLYLDAEGLDAKIILSLDLKEIDIPFICFEASHTDGAFTREETAVEVFKFLTDHNYGIYSFFHKIDNQMDWNWWAIKDNDEELAKDIVEFGGHKTKVKSQDSILVQVFDSSTSSKNHQLAVKCL